MTDTLPSAHSDRLLAFGGRVTIVHVIGSAIVQLTAGRLDLVYAVWCTALFIGGMVLLVVGFWNGIQRSRFDDVTLSGLVAIDSSHVPASARNRIWMLIVVHVVVGVLFASLRPFTQQAFGLLVPAFGLGIATAWGSRFAAFHERDER